MPKYQSDIEFKAIPGQFNVDEAQGIVECFVAGIGNKDSVGDVLVTGAFAKSLTRRKPRVVWGHNWNDPIGKVLEIYEVPPGDRRLPSKMLQAGIGGLYAKVQFNLNSEKGREAFANVAFFGQEQEWSIGYKTLDSIFDPSMQANVLKEVELYEVSPVLHGANQLTGTISVKSDGLAIAEEEKGWGMMGPNHMGGHSHIMGRNPMGPNVIVIREDDDDKYESEKPIFAEGLARPIGGQQRQNLEREIMERTGAQVRLIEATENTAVFSRMMPNGSPIVFRIGYHTPDNYRTFMFGKPELANGQNISPREANKPSGSRVVVPSQMPSMPMQVKPNYEQNFGMIMPKSEDGEKSDLANQLSQLEEILMEETEEKVGRTINKRNLTKLRSILEGLQEVISSAEKEDLETKGYVIPVAIENAFHTKQLLDPIFDYHRVETQVTENGIEITSGVTPEFIEAIGVAEKALGRAIGGGLGKVRRGARGISARFDPNAWDGDGDGIVQEGTPFQRPAIPGVNDRSTRGRVDAAAATRAWKKQQTGGKTPTAKRGMRSSVEKKPDVVSGEVMDWKQRDRKNATDAVEKEFGNYYEEDVKTVVADILKETDFSDFDESPGKTLSDIRKRVLDSILDGDLNTRREPEELAGAIGDAISRIVENRFYPKDRTTTDNFGEALRAATRPRSKRETQIDEVIDEWKTNFAKDIARSERSARPSRSDISQAKDRAAESRKTLIRSAQDDYYEPEEFALELSSIVEDDPSTDINKLLRDSLASVEKGLKENPDSKNLKKIKNQLEEALGDDEDGFMADLRDAAENSKYSTAFNVEREAARGMASRSSGRGMASRDRGTPEEIWNDSARNDALDKFLEGADEEDIPELEKEFEKREQEFFEDWMAEQADRRRADRGMRSTLAEANERRERGLTPGTAGSGRGGSKRSGGTGQSSEAGSYAPNTSERDKKVLERLKDLGLSDDEIELLTGIPDGGRATERGMASRGMRSSIDMDDLDDMPYDDIDDRLDQLKIDSSDMAQEYIDGDSIENIAKRNNTSPADVRGWIRWAFDHDPKFEDYDYSDDPDFKDRTSRLSGRERSQLADREDIEFEASREDRGMRSGRQGKPEPDPVLAELIKRTRETGLSEKPFRPRRGGRGESDSPRSGRGMRSRGGAEGDYESRMAERDYRENLEKDFQSRREYEDAADNWLEKNPGKTEDDFKRTQEYEDALESFEDAELDRQVDLEERRAERGMRSGTERPSKDAVIRDLRKIENEEDFFEWLGEGIYLNYSDGEPFTKRNDDNVKTPYLYSKRSYSGTLKEILEQIKKDKENKKIDKDNISSSRSSVDDSDIASAIDELEKKLGKNKKYKLEIAGETPTNSDGEWDIEPDQEFLRMKITPEDGDDAGFEIDIDKPSIAMRNTRGMRSSASRDDRDYRESLEKDFQSRREYEDAADNWLEKNPGKTEDDFKRTQEYEDALESFEDAELDRQVDLEERRAERGMRSGTERPPTKTVNFIFPGSGYQKGEFFPVLERDLRLVQEYSDIEDLEGVRELIGRIQKAKDETMDLSDEDIVRYLRELDLIMEEGLFDEYDSINSLIFGLRKALADSADTVKPGGADARGMKSTTSRNFRSQSGSIKPKKKIEISLSPDEIGVLTDEVDGIIDRSSNKEPLRSLKKKLKDSKDGKFDIEPDEYESIIKSIDEARGAGIKDPDIYDILEQAVDSNDGKYSSAEFSGRGLRSSNRGRRPNNGAPSDMTEGEQKELIFWARKQKGLTLTNRIIDEFDKNDGELPPSRWKALRTLYANLGSNTGRRGLFGKKKREAVGDRAAGRNARSRTGGGGRSIVASEISFAGGGVQTDGWEKIGGNQGGSQPGELLRDPASGLDYYVKEPKSDLHAENESLVSKLYKRLGVKASEVEKGQKGGKSRIVSKWIKGSKKVDSHERRAQDAQWKKAVQDSYVANAWLANWDATGNPGNIVEGPDGMPYIIDTGGGGLFRAQGEAKGDQFGAEVREMETLLDPRQNPLGKMYYEDVPREEIARQVRELSKITDDEIREMVSTSISDPEVAKKLADTLIARRDYLVENWSTGEKKPSRGRGSGRAVRVGAVRGMRSEYDEARGPKGRSVTSVRRIDEVAGGPGGQGGVGGRQMGDDQKIKGKRFDEVKPANWDEMDFDEKYEWMLGDGRPENSGMSQDVYKGMMRQLAEEELAEEERKLTPSQKRQRRKESGDITERLKEQERVDRAERSAREEKKKKQKESTKKKIKKIFAKPESQEESVKNRDNLQESLRKKFERAEASINRRETKKDEDIDEALGDNHKDFWRNSVDALDSDTMSLADIDALIQEIEMFLGLAESDSPGEKKSIQAAEALLEDVQNAREYFAIDPFAQPENGTATRGMRSGWNDGSERFRNIAKDDGTIGLSPTELKLQKKPDLTALTTYLEWKKSKERRGGAGATRGMRSGGPTTPGKTMVTEEATFFKDIETSIPKELRRAQKEGNSKAVLGFNKLLEIIKRNEASKTGSRRTNAGSIYFTAEEADEILEALMYALDQQMDRDGEKRAGWYAKLIELISAAALSTFVNKRTPEIGKTTRTAKNSRGQSREIPVLPEV